MALSDDLGLHELLETGLLDADVVLAGGQLRRNEDPGIVCFDFARGAVAWFVIVTMASAMSAPAPSTTVPVIVPVVLCPKLTAANSSVRNAASGDLLIGDLGIMVYLLNFFEPIDAELRTYAPSSARDPEIRLNSERSDPNGNWSGAEEKSFLCEFKGLVISSSNFVDSY